MTFERGDRHPTHGFTVRQAGVSALTDRQQVERQLEAGILHGRYPQGSRLPSERELAQQFNVSRPLVREVLRVLSERELIAIRPGRGTFVQETRAGDVARPVEALLRRQAITARELIEARTMLECRAAAYAATRATSEHVEVMARAIRICEAATDLIEQTRYDLAFHVAVSRAAGNPVIETMFASIANLIAEVMLRSLADRAISQEALPWHRSILEAVRAGDAEAAETAMRAHLAVAERYYAGDLDASLARVAARELARLVQPLDIVDELVHDASQLAGLEHDEATTRNDEGYA